MCDMETKHRMRFTNVERGGYVTIYTATITLDDVAVGYVQKTRDGTDYKAYVGGVMAGRGRTLAEVRQDLREHFAYEYPDARESW